MDIHGQTLNGVAPNTRSVCSLKGKNRLPVAYSSKKRKMVEKKLMAFIPMSISNPILPSFGQRHAKILSSIDSVHVWQEDLVVSMFVINFLS